ncbi:MAG: hypothetical protein EAZ76_15760 [Nostocales cyanobacterium]|nr:MAG: hypothetical protein EAZ87_05945 [Nostocales cyanobacterium]TAF10250.1 MAG: hypothetical protein EAZ76_15760 [Nostocales cyanobacterium]
MIRRSLLTAALILAGSVAIAPKASAQSVDVPFTGSIGGACNVGQVTPGVLGSYSPNPGNPTMLISEPMYGGTRGLVSVSCNQNSEVSVTVPVQTGGPSFIPIYFYSNVVSPHGSSWADMNGNNGTHIIPMGGPTQLDVGMIVDKGVALTPGVYNFVTTVNITPL